MPEIGINDVLVKVHRTAICGTDIHIYNWDEWAQKTIPVPLVVGHEFVGEIVDIGSNVIDFHEGQIVSGEGHIVCGRCRNCMAGNRHYCNHTSGIGVNRTGAFAEYIALPMSNVWVHDENIDKDIAAVFDPFGNATHTALQWDLLGEDEMSGNPQALNDMIANMNHGGKISMLAELSAFLETEDTILYPSCFDANGGLFETILDDQDAVISDALNHASIIDGVRLCKAKRYRYENNDMEKLEQCLQEADKAGARIKLITTDGVFSMDGYVANLKAICDLADKYNALVHVDDCHATGFVGKGGKGSHEYCGVLRES
ncbi:L-threonine 3-dehydrogenase [Nymphon striatum]|nr:L-threonine 3-dehydrogenase [Nymphon striatum]